MDKYLNDALNVWLEENESEVNVKEYVRAFRFAGLTRENSYNFKRLTETEINAIESKLYEKLGQVIEDIMTGYNSMNDSDLDYDYSDYD